MGEEEVSIMSIANSMLIDAIIRSNSVEEADLAIRLGADVNALNPVTVKHNGTERQVGVTPLMGSLTKHGTDPRIVQLLLENGADPMYYKAKSRTGAIHIASYSAESKVLELLVKCRLVDVNIPDNDNMTPLVAAVAGGKTANMRVLLDAGAEVNYGGQENIFPVVEATKRNDEHALSVLFEYDVEVNVKDSDSASPLHYAAMLNNVTMSKMLISKHADLEARDSNQQTPLLRACADGKSEVAIALIDAGADINAQDIAGMSPLMFAAKYGNNELADYLVSKGAKIMAVDARGFDALTYAYAKHGNEHLIGLLRDSTSNVAQPKKSENAPDRRKVI